MAMNEHPMMAMARKLVSAMVADEVEKAAKRMGCAPNRESVAAAMCRELDKKPSDPFKRTRG